MTSEELILKIATDNNGIVTSNQITKAGISREYLRILVRKGLLEHSDRGIYILPSYFDDEMFNLQTRFTRGIFSHETALYLLDLIDNTPMAFDMTFPLDYNTSKLKNENVRYYRVKKELHSLGIITVKSPANNPIRIYNAERTLCDILKARSNTDIQIISSTFKTYVNHSNKNIPLLSEYAKMLRVEKKLRSYLEVLL